MAWVSQWMWTTGAIPLLTFGLLLFPDGHLPSRHWRPIAWLAGATVAMFVLGSAVQPGPMPGYDPAGDRQLHGVADQADLDLLAAIRPAGVVADAGEGDRPARDRRSW